MNKLLRIFPIRLQMRTKKNLQKKERVDVIACVFVLVPNIVNTASLILLASVSDPYSLRKCLKKKSEPENFL